jgi:4-hydroxy-2-oxoheptanedioate aldolase
VFRPNALKRRLAAGRRALGCWTVLGSPPVIELLAYCGFDYLLLDQEHGFGEPSALLHSLQAMAAAPNCTSVVRVPSNDPNYLKRVLDAGVEGVMVPNVETAEEARAVVAACRYPPAGRRGSALGSARASDYGISAAKYKAEAANELLIVVQIESPKAVENIRAIAAVDGIDVLFIGPHDLSGSVGQLGELKHPEVAKLIARAEEAIRQSGKPMGTVPHPGATWREMFQRGYHMINAGSDVGRLRDAALADIKEFRSVYPE